MSVQFGEIHNVVRTYQRVLKITLEEPEASVQPSARKTDRVSISSQASKLNKTYEEEPRHRMFAEVNGPYDESHR